MRMKVDGRRLPHRARIIYAGEVRDVRACGQAQRASLGLSFRPTENTHRDVRSLVLSLSLYIFVAHVAGGTHHAFRDYGEGFCIFSDIAVAANVLLQRYSPSSSIASSSSSSSSSLWTM
mmetsp:Transcript_9500/g.17077  ORF Transcript_9500/g.17077 Transcript_9500/m.17077 type:complete len:119 (-) Transcript_9500:14-370(-)